MHLLYSILLPSYHLVFTSPTHPSHHPSPSPSSLHPPITSSHHPPSFTPSLPSSLHPPITSSHHPPSFTPSLPSPLCLLQTEGGTSGFCWQLPPQQPDVNADARLFNGVLVWWLHTGTLHGARGLLWGTRHSAYALRNGQQTIDTTQTARHVYKQPSYHALFCLCTTTGRAIHQFHVTIWYISYRMNSNELLICNTSWLL